MKLIRSMLLAIGIFFVSLQPVMAVDIITKKSDQKRINGTISAMSKNDLTLKRPQGEDTVPAGDIALIEWDGAPPDLKLGATDESAGRYDLATQRVLKAKTDSKSPSNFLQGEFEYVLARIAAKQGLADTEKRDQGIQKLIAAQKAYPEHVRFYESTLLLAQLQLAAKDFAGARKTVDVLKKATSSDLNLAAQIIDARVLSAEGKTDEAIASFEKAAGAAGDSPAEAARKSEALLGQAQCLIQRSKFEDALSILQSITEKKDPDEDTAVAAEAYLLQGQALSGLGRVKEAILSYLYVDINYPREANFDAQALYYLVPLLKTDQHPERSAEIAAKLVQLYPNSEWRKKLAGNE